MQNVRRSLFIINPGQAPLSRPTGQATSPVTGQGYNLGSNLNNNQNNMAIDPNAAAKLVQKGVQTYQNLDANQKAAIGEGIKQVSGKIRGSGNGKRSGPNVGLGFNTHSSGYALTQAPNPRPNSLDTGIIPNTYTTDYMEAVYQACVPFHMTGAKFVFPTTASNALYSFFNNVIAFEIQTNAQVNVGFNINISTDFSAANILSAFNALVYALQVYFYYSSIISYHSNPSNRNKGVIFLRTGITAQLIEDLALLERRLLDTPVPPNLLSFIRYISGIYSTGNQPGAPLIKIFPIAPSTSGIDTTAAATALTALSTTANNTVYSLMRRAVPHWKPQMLYDIPTDPVYDENFKTIFANLPFVSYFSATSNNRPLASTDTTVNVYNAYSNILDGAAYAMTGAYNVAATDWWPGLMVPTTVTATSTANNTRMSYYTNSTNTVYQFYPSDPDPYISRSRQETISVGDNGTSLYSVHLSGARLCQSVSPATIRETSYKVVDWLMSMDQIKVDARRYNFAAPGVRKDNTRKKGVK